MIDQLPQTDLCHNDPPSDDEDVARLRLELRHKSLEELVERGLVEYNRERHVVTRGTDFSEEIIEKVRPIHFQSPTEPVRN